MGNTLKSGGDGVLELLAKEVCLYSKCFAVRPRLHESLIMTGNIYHPLLRKKVSICALLVL